MTNPLQFNEYSNGLAELPLCMLGNSIGLVEKQLHRSISVNKIRIMFEQKQNNDELK